MFDLLTPHPADGDTFLLPPHEESFHAGPPPHATPLREANLQWVEAELASMSIEEMIGQMIVSDKHTQGDQLIDEYHLGGFVFLGNRQSAEEIVSSVNRLQAHARRPLWFAIDSEAGLGARVADATIFPMLMAFGAIADPSLIEEWGRITARESRALGIQVAYGPVLDANTEPGNPIVSTRAASDDPERIVRVARGFVRGARSEGALCTYKHYPGHGATSGDSHSSLPSVDVPLSTIESVHLKPYRDLVKAGEIDLVMTAHVWFPQVHPEGPLPATLSAVFNREILRDRIGFEGVLISDSYVMKGLVTAVPDEGERALLGIAAGLDVILSPDDAGLVHRTIRAAVADGRISAGRVAESARRVLIAKSRAGLPERRTVDPLAWKSILNHPDHRATARRICEASFTCLVDRIGARPLIAPADNVLVLALAATQRIFYRFASSYFTGPFSERVPDAVVVGVPTVIPPAMREALLARAARAEKVLVLGYDWHSIESADQVALINELTGQPQPVIYVSFGAPYHHRQIPDVDACFCGYASVPAMQETAVEVLLGVRPASGRLPVRVDIPTG